MIAIKQVAEYNRAVGCSRTRLTPVHHRRVTMTAHAQNTLIESQLKRCPRCAEMKPKSAFYRSVKGAIQSHCKECMLSYMKWHRKNITSGKDSSEVALCCICKEIKPVSEFYTHEGQKIDAGSRCWFCRKKRRDKKAMDLIKRLGLKEKVCSKCQVMKDISRFHKNRSASDGFQTWCIACARAAQIRSHLRNPEIYSVEHSRRKFGDKEHTIARMFTSAKSRAKKKSIPFNLQIKDVFIPDKCPALGIALDYSAKKKLRPNSPSLDRRIPELGYVRGNVSVISIKANLIKNDSTIGELAAILAYCQVMS